MNISLLESRRGRVNGFELAGKRMVHEQLELRGITDRKVLDAFLKVERHLFVPENVKEYAYEDCPLPIGGRGGRLFLNRI